MLIEPAAKPNAASVQRQRPEFVRLWRVWLDEVFPRPWMWSTSRRCVKNVFTVCVGGSERERSAFVHRHEFCSEKYEEERREWQVSEVGERRRST